MIQWVEHTGMVGGWPTTVKTYWEGLYNNKESFGLLLCLMGNGVLSLLEIRIIIIIHFLLGIKIVIN